MLLLTHGAGSNRNAPLLVAIAKELDGIDVIRYDLPFRQQRPSGPPRPADAARDREGLRQQMKELRARANGPLYLGGVSYGGRQASMLAAEEPDIADGLLLLSYPLHPPGKPAQLRTAHLLNLQIPVLFVHGSRDPFGSLEEMSAALPLIPARTHLEAVQGVGHDLKGAAKIAAQAFREFFK